MTMKKKILILGCNSYQIPLIKEAKKLNYDIFVISKYYNKKIDNLVNNFFRIDLKNPDKIYKIVKDFKIKNVVTTGSDLALLPLGNLNEFLKLDGITSKDANLVNNKILQKKFFGKCKILTPKYQKVKSLKKIKTSLNFPIIIKRIDLSGSKDTVIFKNKDDLNLNKIKFFKKNKIILEQLIIGKEFGAQVVFKNKKILDIIPHGDFVSSGSTSTPVGHYLPLELENNVSMSIKSYAQKIIRNIDAKSGFINFDFILKKEKLYVLEFSIRPGGTGIPELIKAATKKNFFKLLILDGEKKFNYGKKISLPKKIYFTYLLKSKRSGVLKKINIKNKYKKIIKILKVDHDYEYGQKVSKFKYGNHRIGMILGISYCKYIDLQKYLEDMIEINVK